MNITAAVAASHATITDPTLLTSDQVAARLKVSVRTLWRLVKAGRVPQPVRYSRKLVRWKRDDLCKYIESLG